MADPRSARGSHAIKKLKAYDELFTVPELLALLSTPVETRVQYGYNQRGELVLERILFRETSQRRELVQLQRVVRTNEVGRIVQTTIATIALNERFGVTNLRESSSAVRTDSQTQVDEQAAGSAATDEQGVLSATWPKPIYGKKPDRATYGSCSRN